MPASMSASTAKLAPAHEGPTERPRFQRKFWPVLCLLLAASTLALYNGVGGHGFSNYDDDRYILTNAHVQAGLRWSTVTWAFTSLEEANWHPLTWISHALDCQLFQLSPRGHHYTSLLLHAANVVLLFLLLVGVTRSTGRSMMVAALFAVHPLNVESVAWVAERKNVLAMLFFLLTVYGYAWYARQPGLVRYLMVAVLFAMGLMSKPMVITLPFVLLLLDYWPLGRMYPYQAAQARTGGSEYSPQPMRRLWLEKVPLFALSAGSAILTMAAQKAGGAVSFNAAQAPLLRLENAIVCYSLYIVKAFWPGRLAVLYPYPHAVQLLKVLASGLFLVTVTALVIKYRKHRYLPVGWFWYLGTMVPMIGLVQVGNQAMADRYAYLPLLGIFVMVVWGVADLARVEHTAPEAAGLHRASPKFVGAVAVSAVTVLALAAMTRAQLSYWDDDLRLWTHTLSVTGANFVAENAVGTTLAQRGRYEEAIVHMRAASALKPDDPVSQLNLGVYAQQHGDLKQAVARYRAALQLATDRRIRSTAYAGLGQIYFSERDYARARHNFESAAKLDKPFPIQLGLLAQKEGDWNAAAEYYASALAAEPSDVGFLLLEQALRNAGREKDAERAHEVAQLHSRDLQKAQKTADDLLQQ
jgi:tetratricopeptide (TPR) repeat protein